MNDATIRARELLFETEHLLCEDWHVLCDFDGTVSLSDVTDLLLTRFGRDGYQELEDQWANGRIGSRECMGGQIALLDANKAELDAALDTIELDPAFNEFVAYATNLGMKLSIVSDGLDYAIQRILSRNGIMELPIFANRLLQTGERQWKLEFPYAAADCRKASGHCKCVRVDLCQSKQERVLFVGDGGSDFCASGRSDFVLAKSKLIQYCQQQNIAHQSIDGFAQATQFLRLHFPADD